MKKNIITCGQYGSGKTEFCVNLALNLRKKSGIKVNIADYDVINPYFRSREKAEFLKPLGIEILGNVIDNQLGTDLPAFAANIHAPILNDEFLIIDLAGSRNGLKPLALIRDKLADYEFLCVLNAFRPGTDTEAGMIKTLKEMETFSGLKLTGVVHNSHLVRETMPEHILHGQRLVMSAAAGMNLPLIYTLVKRDVYDLIKSDLIGSPIVFDELTMRSDWF